MGANQQYNLRWNDFHTTLASSFSLLRNDSDFIDVTLACDGQSFNAHKVVISACSVYLKKLLKTNPCQHPIVILRDVKASVLSSLLHFMYHGAVDITQNQLSDFLQAAQMLEIKGLSEEPGLGCPKTILGPETVNRRLNMNASPVAPKLDRTTPSVKRLKVNESRELQELSAINRSQSDFIDELSSHTEFDNESDSSQLDNSVSMKYISGPLNPDLTVSPVEKTVDKNIPPITEIGIDENSQPSPLVELKEEDQGYSGAVKQEPMDEPSYSSEYNEEKNSADNEKSLDYGETSLPSFSNNSAYMTPPVTLPGPSNQGVFFNDDSRLYPCTICGKGFKYARSLKVHYQEIHEDIPQDKYVQCTLCVRKYKTKRQLIAHMNQCHGILTKRKHYGMPSAVALTPRITTDCSNLPIVDGQLGLSKERKNANAYGVNS